MTTPLIILGCGYLGARVARAALAEGRTVRVCARSTGRLAPLAALGAEVKYADVAMPKLGPILSGLPGATVVYSVPPVSTLPPGRAIGQAMQAAYGAGAATFIHFSSTGLYGDQPDDDVWIDETTPVVRDDPPMMGVQNDEEAVAANTFERLRTVILRLAPVYGPGRGVRARLRSGNYRLLDDGEHAISRIHADDVARVVFAAEQHAPAGSRYLVADDEPTTQLEYARWLCDRLGLPMPPSRPFHAPDLPRVAHRNRRVRNGHMKRELGVVLQYPSFREGEAQIEAEEAANG